MKRAKVGVKFPATGTPLAVEGCDTRAESVAVGAGEGEGLAVADGVASNAGKLEFPSAASTTKDRDNLCKIPFSSV